MTVAMKGADSSPTDGVNYRRVKHVDCVAHIAE